MQNLKQHWNVLKQETSRSKTLGWGWFVFSLLASVGLITVWWKTSSLVAYVFHEPRAAKAVTASLFALAFLLWLARCWRTYHTRLMSDLAKAWQNQTEHLRVIAGQEYTGEMLSQRTKSSPHNIDQPFLDDVDRWRLCAESAMHQISEAHRDAFYKDSKCFQETPDPNQFAGWMAGRLTVLRRTRKELQALPKHLEPYVQFTIPAIRE